MNDGEESQEAAHEQAGTDPAVKVALQELVKFGYLEEARKPKIYRHAVVHQAALLTALEPLDLSLRLDTHRGLALLVLLPRDEEDAGEAWSHPLVRRQRLTLEQSLLVAILREVFLVHEQERGVGQAEARVALEDLLPKFLTYLPDSGSDQRNEGRLASLLDQLKAHGIVSEIDKNEEVTIRPLIVHLADAESLGELLKVYQREEETKR
jgi:hypothetical protein